MEIIENNDDSVVVDSPHTGRRYRISLKLDGDRETTDVTEEEVPGRENKVFGLELDGESLDLGFKKVEGDQLFGQVLGRSHWPPRLGEIKEATIYVFATPIAEYVDLEKKIDELEDETVKMGELPTYAKAGQSVEVELNENTYYDMFCIGFEAEDDTGKMLGGGRFSTGESDEVPGALTFDEVRFMGLVATGLSIDEGKEIDARVKPMTAWGNTGGRLIIAGLEFGQMDDDDPLSNVGVMADHMGGVDFMHGIGPEKIREYLGVEPVAA